MITYTDPALATDTRTDDAPRRVTATGYGRKIPTRHMIRYAGRWRRVYVMTFSNIGSAYVIVGGQEAFLDTDTEHRLNTL